MSKQIEINLDSTALGSSACILNLIKTLIGELPDDSSPEPIVGAYREKAMNIELLYGICVHAFIDTMFKTSGHYPTAQKKAKELFTTIPHNPNPKKLWMSDHKHLWITCQQTWTDYI